MAEKPEEVSVVTENRKVLADFVDNQGSPMQLGRNARDAGDPDPLDGATAAVTSPEEVEQTQKSTANAHPNRDANDAIEIAGILNVLEDPDFERDQFFETFRRRLRELDLLEDDFFDLDEHVQPELHAPTYPVGDTKYTNCEICLEWKSLHLRHCCDLPVCSECLSRYVNTQVSQAIVKIECLSTVCDSYIHREEIVAVLEPEQKEKFYRFLVDANKEPHIKTCPRCSHISSVDPELIKAFKQQKQGHKITCPTCELEWCFPCQSPWHEGMACKDFQKGDKLLNTWAREHHFGQANAQKCPHCRIFIQRSSGCDHMTCTKCKTNFCYRCGERFIEIRFIGDHYSKLSIFGCKYRFNPDHPVKRRLIRGAIFGSKLVAAPLVAGLAIGAGAVLLGVGVLALPFYGSYKLHRRITQKKRAKRQKEAIAEWRKKMLSRGDPGDPYLENWRHMQELGIDMSHMYRAGRVGYTGEELEISCPMTNTDNLAEIEASQLEHSKTDSWFSEDSWETESEAEQGKVTEVKVITERVNLGLFASLEKEREKSRSLERKQSGEEEKPKSSKDWGSDKCDLRVTLDVKKSASDPGLSHPPDTLALHFTKNGEPQLATLASPEQMSTEISEDDHDDNSVSMATGDPVSTEPESQSQDPQEENFTEAVSGVTSEIKVLREGESERTVCIYRL